MATGVFNNCSFDLSTAFEFTTCVIINSVLDVANFNRTIKHVKFINSEISNDSTVRLMFSSSKCKHGNISEFINCKLSNLNFYLYDGVTLIIKNCTLNNVIFSGDTSNIIQENNIIIQVII